LPDGRYTLRVRAQDANNLEGRNADQSFVLKARPEPPFTTTPPEAGNLYGEAAHLAWASAGAAQHYRLQVARADDLNFERNVLDDPQVSPTQYAAKLDPGSYRWRVASVAKDNDQGPFGDPLTFTLKPMPTSPQMQTPEASKEAIVLRWRAPQLGQKVRYQISRHADFSNLLVDAVTDKAQGRLEKPRAGSYYIRARTIDADGFEGNFGATQQVSIERSTWWMLLPAVAAVLLM
jgi:predicted phage tail protein